jgi:hypothetical protein
MADTGALVGRAGSMARANPRPTKREMNFQLFWLRAVLVNAQ